MDISIAIRIVGVSGRDIEDFVVKNVQNIDTGKIPARVPGLGFCYDSQRIFAIED